MSQSLVIHAAGDLRLEDCPEQPLQAGEVRVRLGAGGICGSDLHYFAHGGVGNFLVRQPLTLGHKVAGTVQEVGPGVTGLAPGARVAVNPVRPCLSCDQCLAGRPNLCRNVLFYGSAARFPHVQGAFSHSFVAHQSQCFPIPHHLCFEVAALAKPLAVTLHAVNQAEPLLGKSVLIVGSGPIGALTVLSARLAGARQITVTDLQDQPLAVSKQLGAERTVNVGRESLDELEVDTAFEASGTPPGLASAISALAPGGTLVQLGMLPPGMTQAPLNLLLARELRLIGSFRFVDEYARALELLAAGRVDLRPLLSARFPLSQAADAFALAADRTRAMKVSLVPDDLHLMPDDLHATTGA
ncbi:L-idonate 5-dehydrogenase [Deinococcus frigens]|uniref:L-idonate 5-dehydrogenase n=1 Tax=Deinococcus frigens TaxID=249403 RepID=UPI00068A1DA3|nr:L-idonate 5-dehydrogenase [Deinococcus frigens]